MVDDQRQAGRYYTRLSPFDLPAFEAWAARIDLPKATILEPFAGSNNLIAMLREKKMCRASVSFDIEPAARGVERRDTIRDFPGGFKICVTNPPWLARNSATRRRLDFPPSRFDNLYKHCLELCLHNCRYVAAIIPASFLQSRLFQSRLHSYILLHGTLFADTENPVCLSLFGEERGETQIWYDDDYIGDLSALKRYVPPKHAIEPGKQKDIRFNAPDGRLGFISFDNTRERSIRFCEAAEIADYDIKVSSRFITRIDGCFGDVRSLVEKLNRAIEAFRNSTRDVFLTPFKGLREDGFYRRRMDFMLARRFVEAEE